MKKRIAVLLTALMIFSLSACGKEEPSQETGGIGSRAYRDYFLALYVRRQRR